MSRQVSIIESSRSDWNVDPINEHKYPGNDVIKLGCLMRIADATEKMASNYQQMENDLKWYKMQLNEVKSANKRLSRSNNALRGYIKRLKKLK